MKHINVLLVDDSADDLALGTSVIEELDNAVTVHCIKDADQAISLLDGNWGNYKPMEIDLVITDWVMPDDGGIKLISHIRSDERLELIPIIVFTGTERTQEINWAYRAGANSVIHKPVGLENYQSTIKMMLDYWTHFAELPSSSLM
ncbi:MAG: response regulator [Oceanococcus sp.]